MGEISGRPEKTVVAEAEWGGQILTAAGLKTVG